MTDFTLHWSDAIGVTGTVITLAAYLATQMRWLNSDDIRFPVINLIGSVMIGISLFFSFNLASALMEVSWMTISLLGIWQWARAR